MSASNSTTAYAIDSASELEVHVLTSHHDATLAKWALISWYTMNDRRDRLFVHDDGSMHEEDYQKFLDAFPGCTVISRHEADSLAAYRLARYPALAEIRTANTLMLKLLDFFFFAGARRFIMIDSDVLSFAPLHGCSCLAEQSPNVFLQDYQHAFNVTKKAFLAFASAQAYRPINTGFGIVDVRTLDLSWANFVIESTDRDSRPFWAEQTLFAILSDPIGIRLLGPECVVAQGEGTSGLTMKHYAGTTRALAYTEGIPLLSKVLA